MIYIILFSILILIIILFFSKINKTDNFMSINILDIKSQNKIPLIMISMLKDIDSLFNKYDITYWLDKETLVNALLFKQTPKNKANICVLYSDKNKIPELKNWLNNMGYDIVKFWQGYKIFPINGVSLKDYNYNWLKYDFDTMDRGEFPKNYDEDYGYMFPYVTIVFCDNYPIIKGKPNIYKYSNKFARMMFPYNIINKEDLFPLNRIRLSNNLYLSIPKNSKKYVNNIYLSNRLGYKSQSLIYKRFRPLVLRKVKAIRN